MQSGQRHELIIILKSELRNERWKVHADGLLEAADGRTEFPTTAPDGRVIGSHSYYLDPTAVVVKHVDISAK